MIELRLRHTIKTLTHAETSSNSHTKADVIKYQKEIKDTSKGVLESTQ